MVNKSSFSLVLAQELLHSRNPFPVDLDDAWQWLGCYDKKTARKMLIQYFAADVDFQLLTSEQLGSLVVSAHEQKIWLTISCLKELAMLLHNKKAKLVLTKLTTVKSLCQIYF